MNEKEKEIRIDKVWIRHHANETWTGESMGKVVSVGSRDDVIKEVIQSLIDLLPEED